MADKNVTVFIILINLLLLYNKFQKILVKFYKAKRNVKSVKYMQVGVVSATIESILNGDNNTTKKSLRINHNTLKNILHLIPKKHHGWSVEYETIIFLYWMACGCSYRVAGDFAGLSRFSIRNIIHKYLNFFSNEMKHLVKFPAENQLNAIGEKFCTRAKTRIFNKAVGAIDGCHIRIKCPINRHDEYINYKLFYSIILQAVVDSSGKFINYFIGFPGSVHDTRVLHNSPLYRRGTFPPENYYLLGDRGYPCILGPCAIITPYKDPNYAQRQFNIRHSKARLVVESTFGLMKNRWRNIFFKALEQNLENCVKIVTAACILHNICMMGEEVNLDPIVNDNEPETEHYGNNNSDTIEGQQYRESLLQQLIVENRNFEYN